MTLAIAGGGIGGLSLALMLEQAGIRFRLFESSDRFRNRGLGLVLRPDAVEALTELGLGASLKLIGVPLTEVAAITAEGIVTETAACGRAAGQEMPQICVHRGRLHRLMVDEVRRRAGADRIVMGAALKDWIDDGEGVVVNFYDRRQHRPAGTVRGTGLVAADGIDSIARARLYPLEGAARWGGVNVWRGIGPGPAPRGGHSTLVIGGPEQRLTISPVRMPGGGLAMLNWVAELRMPPDHLWTDPRWTTPGNVEDVALRFAGWRFDWLDVAAMIRGTEEVYEHPLLEREPLPRWSKGRVALLGDAAHATFQLGSGGASDAVLDAAALVRQLAAGTGIAAAFGAYQKARRAEMASRGRGAWIGAAALPGGGERSWDEALRAAEAEAETRGQRLPPGMPPPRPPAAALGAAAPGAEALGAEAGLAAEPPEGEGPAADVDASAGRS